MNKIEVNAKLQYVFEGLPLSKVQKEMLGDVVMAIMETAVAGVTKPEIAKASDDALGGIKTGYSQNAKNYPVSLDGNGKAYVTVPWIDTNTTYSNATISTAGLMSAADKQKLDNIEANANNYSLPTASSTVKGGITLGYTENGKNYPVEIDSSGKAFVNVPWTDTNTTYNVATTSENGLMSSADKQKLDNLVLVPTDGSTGQVLKKTASGVAWQNDSNTTYSAATENSLGLVKQAAVIDSLTDSDEITTVISTLNTLIANLKTAGIIANS